jgi:hypothetical protein
LMEVAADASLTKTAPATEAANRLSIDLRPCTALLLSSLCCCDRAASIAGFTDALLLLLLDKFIPLTRELSTIAPQSPAIATAFAIAAIGCTNLSYDTKFANSLLRNNVDTKQNGDGGLRYTKGEKIHKWNTFFLVGQMGLSGSSQDKSFCGQWAGQSGLASAQSQGDPIRLSNPTRPTLIS